MIRTTRTKPRRKFREVRSLSAEQTQLLGKELGESLQPPAVVLLCGPLGIGKTTMAKGLASGLGLQDPDAVHSPSFTIVNVYHGRCPVYHVDLYRLGDERDIASVGLEEFLGQDGVSIVEWGERLPAAFDAALIVEFEDEGEDTRIIRIYM